MSLLLSVSLALTLAVAPETSADATAQSRELFTQAKKLYTAKKFGEAVAKFEQAYALKAHPTVMFNIAKCYEQLDARGKALASYRQYLRMAPDASDRQTVKDSVSALERQLQSLGIQQLTVFAEPATASVTIDGKLVGSAPVNVELTQGSHSISVAATGYETQERSVSVALAHASEVSFSLKQGTPDLKRPTEFADAPKNEPAPSVTPATVTTTPETTPPAVAAATPPKARVGTIVAGGVAVAGLAAGIGLGLAASGSSKTLLSTTHTTAEADKLVAATNGAALGANISYGVAAAAAVTAVVLFFVEGRP